MLSPATFIGIAKATAPVPAPGRAPAIQPARVLTSPSVAAPPPLPPPGGGNGGTAISPAPQVRPPRNLPRGSLLDLSV